MKIQVVEQGASSGPKSSFPPPGSTLALQYKEPHEPWEGCKEVAIDDGNELDANEMDLEDLEPGSPYYVRFKLKTSDGNVEYGPETVYDTKPIDCTPKGEKKKCIIS